MGPVYAILLVGIALVSGAEKEATKVEESRSQDGMLSKVTRELLLLEIEDLKKELAHGQGAGSHKEPPIIDSNELVEKKKRKENKDETEKKIAEIREKLMAVLKKKTNSKKSVAESNENQNAKRLVDISQVKSSCEDTLGRQACVFFLRKSDKFCSLDSHLASKCKMTCTKCGVFDAYPQYCKLLREKCQDKGIQGKFLREKCAKTCSQASAITKVCEDDPVQAGFCPVWQKMGACKNKELMSKFCPMTCQYC